MREGKLGFVICVWFWVFCGSCLCRFVVEKNSLKVISPEYLKGTHESAIGNFGVPQYGGTLTGIVVYPTANQNACSNFTDKVVNKTAGGLPVFLLADRGGCFFTLMAWNAQNAGAAAILVVDYRPEQLITMDLPLEEKQADYFRNITIPSVLINLSLGESIKKALNDSPSVRVKLDWTESLPHPDERVEYEFWTNSNDECGPKCDSQIDFVKSFKGVAQILERKGYTQFTPHYITWFCPKDFISTEKCKSQCINHGRYCAPDPEEDFRKGYEGKEVVLQNLRQACFYKVANESRKPWVWWDYVTDFATRCSMKDNRYTKDCADEVIQSLGVDIKKVDECMGNPEEDVENAVLEAEQQAQLGKGVRGDVTILPTLVINNGQYRGKLDKKAVLKAICSGFKETTEPTLCLSDEVETNECLDNNGGCWMDKVANITACKDTFRGRVCECPVVQGVKFVGDGYKHCQAPSELWCQVNNGGCWNSTKEGKSYSACIASKSGPYSEWDHHTQRCECPPGFKGDGVNSCEDIDECKEKTACKCPECRCKNTWGSYECSCTRSLLYVKEHDTCLKTSRDVHTGGGFGFVWFVLGVAAIGVAGYTFYKYRVRRYMDSEIRAIMAQYMPLDNEGEVPVHTSHGDI